MTDLNTAIAVFKGKLPFPKDRCPVCGWKYADDDYGCKPDNCSMRPQPSPRADQICIPDYEHDANLYMTLFEEMGKETDTHEPYDLHIDFIDGSYQCSVVEHGYDYAKDRDNYCPIVVRIADTIGTAICLAYCRLKGIEVAG